MGLDSVELLMAIEKGFGVDIPDKVAATIYTIQDMTQAVADLKGVGVEESKRDKELKMEIMANLQSVFPTAMISPTDKISTYLHKDSTEQWKRLREASVYTIETPYFGDSNWQRVSLSYVFSKPLYKWKDLLVSDFINGVLVANFLEIVDFENSNSLYEIYLGVAGITVDRIGADVYEVTPEKSFVKDLRID
ncbi:hypothetical protein [Moheibacter stercoris]|uniref:Acyl carrier protein n=1 Tax=Moheibacter stercoris TaxID=1628251 RepID=A0ABV2LTX0_9FLAO